MHTSWAGSSCWPGGVTALGCAAPRTMHHACKAISSCSAQLELIRLSRGKPALLSKTCSDNRLPGCWQRGSHRVNFQLGAWRMLPVGLFCGVGEKGGERAEVSGRSCVLPEQAGHWHCSPSSSSAICSCSAHALCHHELQCSSSACASPGQVTQVYSFRAASRVSKHLCVKQGPEPEASFLF